MAAHHAESCQTVAAIVRRFICRFGSSGVDPVLCMHHRSSTLFVCVLPPDKPSDAIRGNMSRVQLTAV